MVGQVHLDPHDHSVRFRLTPVVFSLLLEFRKLLESEGYAPRLVQRKVGYMTRVAEALGDPLEVSPEQVQAYFESRTDLSPITKTAHVTAVNQFYEWRRELGAPLAGSTAGAVVPTGRRARIEFADDSTNAMLLKGFRQSLRANDSSVRTIRLRDWAMRTVALEVGNLLEATKSDLERFLAQRSHYAPETRRSFRASIVTFYEWAYDDGQLPQNPASGLRQVRVPKRMGRIAPDAPVIEATDSASPDVRAMILLARLGGLRVGEVTKVHTDDRDRDEHLLYVIGKGNTERAVPLHPQLEAALDELESIQGPGYYFPGARGGHLNLTTVYKRIKGATGFNPHSLRHAAATTAYSETRDIRAVQTLLGHANISTTEKYVHVDRTQVTAAAHATSMRRAS